MRTFRNPALRWVLPVTGLELAGLSWATGSALGAGLIMGTWLVVAAATYRLRVEADAQRVRIVNYLHTTVLSWGEVEAIGSEYGDSRCVLRLRSGSDLYAWALYAGTAGLGTAGITRAVDELEALRVGYHGPRAHGLRAEHPPAGPLVRTRPAPASAPLVLGVLLAGLGALGGGAYLLADYASFAEHGVPVSAVVTKVSGYKDAEVTVRYTVDGKTLVNTADSWSGWPDVGATVAAEYDATNPARVTDASEIETGSHLLTAVSCLVLGGSSLTFAVVAGIRGPWS